MKFYSPSYEMSKVRKQGPVKVVTIPKRCNIKKGKYVRIISLENEKVFVVSKVRIEGPQKCAPVPLHSKLKVGEHVKLYLIGAKK